MEILPNYYGYGMLSQKQVAMKRKLLDNNLRLVSSIADFVRLEEIEGRTGNRKRYNILAHHYYPCKWPKLEKAPFMRVYLDGIDESKCIEQKITILDTYGKDVDGNKNDSILVRVPYNSEIQKGDLVVRAFVDGKYANVVVYEVIDFEGSFSDTSLLSLKVKLAPTTVELSPNSALYVEIIKLSKIRNKAGY